MRCISPSPASASQLLEDIQQALIPDTLQSSNSNLIHPLPIRMLIFWADCCRLNVRALQHRSAALLQVHQQRSYCNDVHSCAQQV